MLCVPDAEFASGFYIFALANAVAYAAVFAVIVVQHARENAIGPIGALRRPAMGALMLLLFAAPIFAASENGLKGVDSIAWGARYFRLTEATFSVSGAGQAARRVVTFHPRWTISRGAP